MAQKTSRAKNKPRNKSIRAKSKRLAKKKRMMKAKNKR